MRDFVQVMEERPVVRRYSRRPACSPLFHFDRVIRDYTPHWRFVVVQREMEEQARRSP